MQLIDNTDKLIEFCNLLQKQEYITVDSEFIREHSYYPKLCLLQIACEGTEAIIDPLSKVDLSPFFEILQNENIVKVFHAGRQDIEIFYNLSGKIPCNVFDTQIAAMVCGFTENIGYGNLVQEILKVDLDKSCRLTDWSIRPLDESQLEYAICDVTYLRDCYKYLRDYMEQKQRLDWVKEEIDALCDKKCYQINPDECWQKIRHNVHSPQFLAALKYLAAWREIRARKYNTPRSGILKDDALINIASASPKSINELNKVRNLKAEIVKGRLGAEIIEVLQEAAKHPVSAEICRADRKQGVHVPANGQSLLEILRLLLKIKSQEAGVISRIIANDEDLCAIINHQTTHTLQGWRYDVFGQYAQQICKGKMSIVYNPKKKKIEFNTKE